METVFYNGNIITMEGNENPEAVLIIKDKIIKVGALADIKKIISKNARFYDLEGHTLIPAFIDAHSHFSSVAMSRLQVSLEGCKSFDEVKERLLRYVEKEKLKKGAWIIASGYDHNNFDVKEHPKANFIDSFLADYPVVLQHKSGHVGVFNTLALERLGVTNKTEIKGGLIEVKNGRLTGYMEESAYVEYVKKTPMPDVNKIIECYKQAQEEYLSYGITTCQEGIIVKEIIPHLKALLESNKLILEIIGYVSPDCKKEAYNAFKDSYLKYNNNFKIAGYKIMLDGSPQGRTAWMKEAYEGDDNYFGYGRMSDEELLKVAKIAKEDKMQLLAHANGDRAIEQYLKTLLKVDIKELRPVIIHCQLLRLEQLSLIKQTGAIPSFFVAHTYYWGDDHVRNFGMKRASTISPAKSALKSNILFTFHQDAPVISPNMLETIWCAVNRKTKTGVLLGGNERISAYEALKAVTINAAYQYFEEDKK